MNRTTTSLSVLALLALAVPPTARAAPSAPAQDPTTKPASSPIAPATGMPASISPAAPAPGAAPRTLDDLEDIVTHKVRIGAEEFVVQTQGRTLRSIKINGKDAQLSRARVDTDTLRLLDESGATRASIPLPTPGASVAGAGAGQSNFLTAAPSRSRSGQTVTTIAPAAPGLSSSPTSAADLSQLAGRSVMVGLQMVGVDPALSGHLGLAPGSGVMVAGVVAGLPADQAGLKPFDVITRIDTRDDVDVNTLRNVLMERNAKPGEKLKLRVISAGQTKDIELTLMALQVDRLADGKWNSIPEHQLLPGQQTSATTSNTTTITNRLAPRTESLAQAIERAKSAGIATARSDAGRSAISINSVPILTTAPAVPPAGANAPDASGGYGTGGNAAPRAGSPFGLRQIMILPDAEPASVAPEADLEARLLRIETALDEILRRLTAPATTTPMVPLTPSTAVSPAAPVKTPPAPVVRP